MPAANELFSPTIERLSTFAPLMVMLTAILEVGVAVSRQVISSSIVPLVIL